MGRCLVLLLLLLAFVQPALGDAVPLAPVGPHLQPMDSTTVRLEQERIAIRLRHDLEPPGHFGWDAVAEYRIWFRFVPAADEELTVGFPLFVLDQESHLYGAHLRDLKVAIDEQEVATETRKATYGKDAEGGAKSDWAVFPVAFRKDQPLEMVITYAMPVTPFGKSSAADLWVAYVLRTGAFWAGPIGRAEAVLTMDKPIREEDIRIDKAWRTTTPGWRLEEGAMHWVWEDVEPDFDLSVVMANAYWLDTAADIQAMLDEGVSDRDTLLRLIGGTSALVAGDGKFGFWMKLRGDVSSEQAGEALLPEVLDLAETHIASHPEDWEVRESYLWLLRESALHQSVEGAVLLSEVRLARFLRVMHQYTADGGSVAYLQEWRPWMLPEMREQPWGKETQAAMLPFLADALPATFGSEAEMRAWVAENAGNALAPENADILMAEAHRRVKPPEPLNPARARDPQPAPVPEVRPAEPSAPPGHASLLPSWTIWTGGLFLLLGAGALAYRMRSGGRRRSG